MRCGARKAARPFRPGSGIVSSSTCVCYQEPKRSCCLKRILAGGDVGRRYLQPLPVPWAAPRARRMTFGLRLEEQTSGKKGGFLCGVW